MEIEKVDTQQNDIKYSFDNIQNNKSKFSKFLKLHKSLNVFIIWFVRTTDMDFFPEWLPS